MTNWIEFLLNGLLWMVLGGVVAGSIIHAIYKREIRDLKVLLQGFGVLRETGKRRFWPGRWGIRTGR